MITSFSNVDKNFFEQLIGIKDFTVAQLNRSFTDRTGKTFSAIIKSDNTSIDYADEKKLVYPCIVVRGESPYFREGFSPSLHPIFGALRKSSGEATYNDIITQYFEPVPLVFRYEVSVCAKDYDQLTVMNQWIMKFGYGTQKHFVFNKSISIETVFGDLDNGDIVEYTFKKLTDLRPPDNVMISLYEFLVMPYVVIKEAVDMPAIENLFVGVKIK